MLMRLMILAMLLLPACMDMGVNEMIKTEQYYTNLIIDAEKLYTLEKIVKELNIEVRKGGTAESDPTEPFKIFSVQTKTEDGIKSIGNDKIIINDVEIGKYYHLRSRTMSQSGKFSEWSDWVIIQAGNNETNTTTFSAPILNSYEDKIVVKVNLSNVPLNVDRYEIAIQKIAITDMFDSAVPSAPSTPASNISPDLIIKAMPNQTYLEFAFNDPGDSWNYFWIRSIDEKGNKASNSGTNDWYYLGAGRTKIADFMGFIDGSFKEVYYDQTNSEERLSNWMFSGFTEGAKFATILHGVSLSIWYPVKSGGRALSTTANSEIFNRVLAKVDNSKEYTLDFFIAYDAYAINNVETAEDAMTIKIYEYNISKTLVTTQTVFNGIINGFVNNAYEWVHLSGVLNSLNANTQYVRVGIETECSYIFFDDIKLTERVVADKIVPGTFTGAYKSSDGTLGTAITNMKVVTDIQFLSTTLQYKYRNLTMKDGLVTNISSESAWTDVPTASA